MIKFFRKIRQKLLTENKFSKYLIYAIGEVILVVIGILIAIQINNWNQDKKERKTEISILTELLNDSKANTFSLKEDLDLNKRCIKSNHLIKNALTKGMTYHDSLDIHFGNIQYNTQFIINNGGYENLKSRGFEIISNDAVRKSIINFHDRWLDFIVSLGEINNKISIEQFNPQYQAYFFDIGRDNTYASFKPLNYKDLINNNEFLRLISHQKYNNEHTIQVLEKAIEQVKDLMNKLESELEKK